jgi:hypothetical protein
LLPCPSERHQTKSPWTNCFGTYIYAKGNEYVGAFKDDKRHGQGTYYWLADNEFKGAKYVGEWKDGKWHGQGTYTFADGRVKEGIYENGKFLYAKKPPPKVTNSTRTPSTKSEPTSPPASNIEERLKALQKLEEMDLITKEEAAKKRQAILDSL